jgi:NADH-quinone oxidoreductase subunit L
MFVLLLAGALLTAFYTFRLLFLAFSGAPRMGKEVLQHAHESPWVMTAPLGLLALLTVVAGFVLGLPLDGTRFARRLASVFAPHEVGHSTLVPLLSVVVVAARFGLAVSGYRLAPVKPGRVGLPSTPLRALLLIAY